MPLSDELRAGLKNLTLKGGSLAVERSCRLVLVVVGARIIGEAPFGGFVFASTVTAFLAQMTDLGLGSWTTRELARGQQDGDKVLKVALTIRLLAAIPYALALVVFAFLAARGEETAAMLLLGVAAFANALVDQFSAAHRGFERFGEEARLNGARAVLATLLGLAALAWTRSLVGLAVGLAVANVVTCSYGLFTLLRFHDLGSLRLAGSFDRPLGKVALRESLPIWFAGLFALAYFKVDTLFLRSLAGQTELGAYGAAYKFFEGALAVPAVLMAVMFPKLSRVHGDRQAQQRIERVFGLLLFGLGAMAAVVCFLGADVLVRFAFGAGFARAAASLRVLAVGLPLLYLNFGLIHFLIARNLSTRFTWFSMMMLIINVVLDCLLIPHGLGPGAATATVLTEGALTACCLLALRAASPMMSGPREARTTPEAA